MPTKTDSLFSIHKFEIRGRLNETFSIVPVGDIHRESEAFAHDEWERFLKREKTLLAKKHNRFYLLMGDYLDGCSTSERAILANGGMHDTTRATMRNVYRGVCKTVTNELSFMRGRIIGALGGNHHYELENGENTDHVIARALGAQYLGVCGLIRLSIKLEERGGNKSVSLDIFAHHGKGGGKTVGGTFNSIEDMQKVADADIYAMGHTHGKGAMPSFPRMRLVSTPQGSVALRARTPYLGRTGSFLKTYESGRKAYGVDALYPACALGTIEFEVTPRRCQKDGLDITELEIAGRA